MFQDNRLEKVSILLNQEKYDAAKEILRDMLREDPNDISSMIFLVEVYIQEEQYDQAKGLLENAIGLAPNFPDLYYLQSRIALMESKMDLAESALQQAIELNALDANYFALLSNIKLIRKQYDLALENANIALGIDAENLLALNIRSTSLVKLDRTEESFATIEGALREDPNNSYTHANYGWNLLEKGKHKKALEHFKESLSKDPNFEYAQAGMKEAIKATNPIYRLFLKYNFWIGKMNAKNQWTFIIGFYIGFRILRYAAKQNEALAPFLTPIIIVAAIFAFSTWVMEPISNLFLRFNRYGKILLNKKQKLSSNLVALSLAITLCSAILAFVIPDDRFFFVAIFGFLMMMPLGIMFSPTTTKNILVYATIALASLGIIGLVTLFQTGDITNIFATLFLFGIIAFQWGANFVMIKEDNL